MVKTSSCTRSCITILPNWVECNCGERSCARRMHPQSYISTRRTSLARENANTETWKGNSQMQVENWTRAILGRWIYWCMERLEKHSDTRIRRTFQDRNIGRMQNTGVPEFEIDLRVPGVPEEMVQQDKNKMKEQGRASKNIENRFQRRLHTKRSIKRRHVLEGIFLWLWTLLTSWRSGYWKCQGKIRNLECTMGPSSNEFKRKEGWRAALAKRPLESHGRLQRCQEASLFLNPRQMAKRFNVLGFPEDNWVGWHPLRVSGLLEHSRHFVQGAASPESPLRAMKSGSRDLQAGPRQRREDFKETTRTLESLRREQGKVNSFHTNG